MLLPQLAPLPSPSPFPSLIYMCCYTQHRAVQTSRPDRGCRDLSCRSRACRAQQTEASRGADQSGWRERRPEDAEPPQRLDAGRPPRDASASLLMGSLGSCAPARGRGGTRRAPGWCPASAWVAD
ncbi:hypothetical protein NDU88_008633 [Pleurodeles waltl]|uniref:Uncharacterized protein n=1 Tax=Pleurodeles waltl TaxID=8319 RepID=A0AAV7P1H0_PLEWA|nr:hypothetical protein NDU88_008633 [Pleurodeles waltl]